MPVSLRGRSGQGHDRRVVTMAGQCSGSEVGTATDLSLLTPRPETSENSLIMVRAGEIEATESDKRAKSSANANERKFLSSEIKTRRGS